MLPTRTDRARRFVLRFKPYPPKEWNLGCRCPFRGQMAFILESSSLLWWPEVLVHSLENGCLHGDPECFPPSHPTSPKGRAEGGLASGWCGGRGAGLALVQHAGIWCLAPGGPG